MGYPRQVQVDSAALAAIAGEVREAAAALTAALSSAGDGLVPDSAGWAAASAAGSAQQAWAGFLAGLGKDVSGLAADLDAAAKGYAEADRAAADRIGAGRAVPR